MPQSTRRSIWPRWVGIFIGVTLLFATFRSQADSIGEPAIRIPLVNDLAIDLGFACDPPLGACNLMATTEGKTSYQCADYNLDIAMGSGQKTQTVSFQLSRSDGATFDLYDYGARIVFPYTLGDAVWCYNRLAVRNIMTTDLRSPFEEYSAANLGIPFVAFVDGSGNNRLSIGLMSQNHRVWIRGDLNEEQGTYAISVKQVDPFQTNRIADAFFVSQTRDSWFQRAKAYTAAVDASRNYTPLNIPPHAYNPTYDSWYWTFDGINQDLVWQLAQRSRTLGFKSYLLDAGWDTHAGEYFLWLDGSTGDYEPPHDSFPDFRGLLNRIRNQLGMRVMFWMQQYALGRHSTYYPQLAGSLSNVVDTETQILKEIPALCPRVPETRQHMAELFGRMMDDYHPDAFWFDWQEEIPYICSAPHYHDSLQIGEGYNATQQVITDTIRQRDTSAFVEMRWPFANLNNKPYVQLWQPTDSPEDFEAMRLRAMNMRPFSSGVLMGTDEMYWDPRISDVEAARFMATVVFTGVPYFGPNLLAEPSSRLEMLRAWLQFYETNRRDLTKGKFMPYGNRNRPDQFIEGSQATFIYYGNRYKTLRLEKTNSRIHIVNASLRRGIDLQLSGLEPGTYEAVVSNLYLQNLGTVQTWTIDGSHRILSDLPVGCLLTLTRIQ